MFYNFWSGFAAFVYCFFVFTFSIEWLERKAPLGLTKVASILCIACAAYVFSIGAYLAVGWSNPFAGQDLTGRVHGGREWIVVGVLVVWPFFLMLVGLATALLGWKTMRRAVAARGRRPVAS